MARPYRLQCENCLYHITSRGDDRKMIFVSEHDFNKFLEYVLSAKERFMFHLYAYCLMNNHYHLLVETTQPNISRIMQYINTSYTIYYNIKRNKCGHLFQGRYKSIIVEADAYFKELTRYIHLNPVRAKMVDSPEKYKWSSYRSYIEKESGKYVDKELVKPLLGMNSSQYRVFVLDGINGLQNPLKDVYAGFIVGSVGFIKDKLKDLKFQVETKELAHKRAIKNMTHPQDIINEVAAYYKQNPSDVCNSKKRPMTAKMTAIYLLTKKTGLTNTEIGAYFNMKHAAVSKSALSFARKLNTKAEYMKAVKQITSKVEV
jgi:putative transposase